jgi:hypothetical protein
MGISTGASVVDGNGPGVATVKCHITTWSLMVKPMGRLGNDNMSRLASLSHLAFNKSQRY